MFAGKHQAQGPAEQQDQVQAEQAAQGPEHIHWGQAIAQGGKRQAGAAENRDDRQQHQGQACALLPACEGAGQAIAFGQVQRAMHDARRQVATGRAGQAVGFEIFQRACVFFAQAHGFGQPEVVQRV
ncbi:hypothetical protein [Pseudomonas sp. 44 R 15]|nr:hypothetical protein [Pseudomonas sp. 44 R 15]